jgi:hydroxymethylglutaryl-CoA synthase
VLPFEPPRRPDPERPAAPPMRRHERWKLAFVGSRCTQCQTGHLPPQRVCVKCGAVDQMRDERFADTSCRVATYTLDHLAYSMQPPVVAAFVDYEGGGRFACELTDVDPKEVAIGNHLEMTFRRLFTAQGVHNYFWKARPGR